jgi:hypothetical protein
MEFISVFILLIPYILLLTVILYNTHFRQNKIASSEWNKSIIEESKVTDETAHFK